MVLGLVALAACSAPVAAGGAPVPTSAPTSDRPKSISMTGLDPCSVFTDDQLRQLGVDPRDKSPKTAHAQCAWVTVNNGSFTSLGAQAVDSLSIDDIRRRITDPTTSLTVQGFPALEWEHSIDSNNPNFQLYVDVADGQTLQVAVHLQGEKNRDKAMQDTQRAANFAITTLLSG